MIFHVCEKGVVMVFQVSDQILPPLPISIKQPLSKYFMGLHKLVKLKQMVPFLQPDFLENGMFTMIKESHQAVQ